MSAKKVNRFYIPELDSEAEEEIVTLPNTVPSPEPPTEPLKTQKSRDWKLEESKTGNGAFRNWNQQQQRPRKPFFRSYAFRDETDGPRRRPYAFRDDDQEISSPPLESVKPNTPMPTDSDFPKLNDYIRPQTPPYPPDDKPYPTLSERIQIAMNKQFPEPPATAKKEPEGYVLKMDSFIPSRNYDTVTLQIT